MIMILILTVLHKPSNSIRYIMEHNIEDYFGISFNLF